MTSTRSISPSDVDLAQAELPGAEMHALLDRLSEQGPLAESTFGGRRCLITTTRKQLLEAFQDVEALPPATLYKNSIAKIIGPNFQSMEGSQHRLYRKLATPAFRSRRIEAFGESAMGELAREMIAPLIARADFDVVADFTHRFPFLVISRLLGVPREREEQFHLWAWQMLGPPGVAPADSHRAAAEFTRYLEPVVIERRNAPRDDVISELIEARVDGEQLDDEMVLSHIRLMFSAGATTTCDAIGNLIHSLLTHSGAWERVVDEPDVRPRAVNEGLRWETPVANLPRISAPRTVKFGGCELAPGTTVLLSMALANRDPAFCRDSSQFDVGREPSELLSFGRGERSCPGMHLARKGIAVALDAFAEGFPKLALIGDPLASAPRRALVRGPRVLPVRVG